MDIEVRYELLEKIGTGSYATVYRARDNELGREVAVKQIHQQYLDDPNQLERYWQEAQLLASLHHPNIVTIFDVFRERGWLILELMQGNLGERMAHRQMDLRGLRTTVAHVLRALKYLHSRGIVHGDIKPTNLMIDHRRRIKVGDFGLARRVSDEEGSLLKGTTKYMAPEVVSDEFGEVGPASDLYSLGFSAYDLMCGPNFESLFPGLSAFGRNKQVAWMMWHAAPDRRLPEIHRVLEGVPDDLASVIQKLCEKDQSKRYDAAEDALEDLNIDVRAVRSEESSADDGEEQPPEGAERKKRMLAIGALSASVILSLLMLFLPSGGGRSGDGGTNTVYGVVREVLAEDNKIVVEDPEAGIPEEIAIGQRPKIFLKNLEKNILLRELQPGDMIAYKPVPKGEERLVTDITAWRPVTSRGRIKSINLTANRIVIAVAAGNTREDLPLFVPDRAEIHLNGRPAELLDLKEGDQATVSHLEEAGGTGSRSVNSLDAQRQITSAGFISYVDLDQGRMKVQYRLGSTSQSLGLPFAEDCKITLQGHLSKPVQRSELEINDRVKFVYDTEFHQIVVSPGKLRLSGMIVDARPSDRQLFFSSRDGKKLTLTMEASCDVMLNREPAGLADLRNSDEADVTYNKSGNKLAATTVDAERPVRKDRWAVVIGTGEYDDQAIPPLDYASRNARRFVETLSKRYAFSADRLRVLLDPTRKTMEKELSEVLASVRTRTQVLVYVSSHAYVADGDRVYLAGKDLELNRVAETGLPLEWLAQKLEACNTDDKILFLDCSHAESLEQSPREPSTAVMLRTLKPSLQSTSAIASCDEGEHGLVWTEKGCGLFAYFLADGFSGRADDNRDLRINATEIFDHLKSGMASVSIEGGASQTPVFFGLKPPRR